MTSHAIIGAGKLVHAVEGGKSLCGLQTMYAASVRPTGRAVDCAECVRMLERQGAGTPAKEAPAPSDTIKAGS